MLSPFDQIRVTLGLSVSRTMIQFHEHDFRNREKVAEKLSWD